MAKTLVRIISAAVAQEDVDRLEELARDADRSLSAEVRRAVREHIQRTAATPREVA